MTNGTHTQEERRRAWEWLAQNVRHLTLDEAVSSLFMDPTGYAVFEAPALEFEGHAPVGEKQLYLIKPEAPEDTDNKLAWLLFVPCVRDLELPDEEGDPESRFIRFAQYAGAVRWADGVQMRLGDLALWFADNDSSSEQSERIHVPASSIGPGFIANDKVTKTVSVASSDRLTEDECNGDWIQVADRMRGETMVSFKTPDGMQLNAEKIEVLDAIASIMEANGQAQIRGTDLLRQIGITNPYQAGQRPTIRHYAEIVDYLMAARIAIDTTAKASKENRNITEEVTLGNVLHGQLKLQRIKSEDGEEVTDFVIVLAPPDNTDLYSATPLYRHAKDLKQVVSVHRSIYELPSGRGQQQRLIRDYLARRIGEHGTSKTITLDAICEYLDIDPKDKTQRNRVARRTESLLEEMKGLDEVAGKTCLNGYEVVRNGRTIHGYKLDTSTPKKRTVKKGSRRH